MTGDAPMAGGVGPVAGGVGPVAGGIGAVLLDLDGVLIDSISIMREAYAEATAGADAPPFADFQRLLGRSLSDIAGRLALPGAFVPRYRRARDARLDRIPAQPGAAAMLRDLRGLGVPTAVVTGKDGASARRVLTKLGMIGLIDVVLGGDELRRPKPDPAHAHAALAALAARRGGPVPSGNALLVGDAEADIRCGRDAGCHTAFAAWGYLGADKLASTPDIYLERPEDVVAVVRRSLAPARTRSD